MSLAQQVSALNLQGLWTLQLLPPCATLTCLHSALVPAVGCYFAGFRFQRSIAFSLMSFWSLPCSTIVATCQS